ncbi:hypothetical protein [Chromobacterium haemolyticum]|uniref:hypothetical protein n=1 Tax=Chromobacterium haemolyticum TaxID=394935 RepID=UPI0005BD7028|nr:hypothetical protein [Chromobacterium haemolyticum]
MKAPWHYLSWTPPQLEVQAERNLAAITRRKGWLWAILLYWGVVEGEALGWHKLRIFLDHNYAGLALGCGVWVADWLTMPGWIAVLVVAALGWVATVLWGTAKYIGWLVSILNRWPPMGKA